MTVKSVLKIIGFIFAFVISSVIILVFLVDANMFKPRIQAIAAQHGVALTMRGDLHWAYWPAMGLAVNDIAIADSDAPQKIIADVKKASFLIAFLPLMEGDFQVKHVLVDGAVIDLDVNEQGMGNWENILNKKSAAPVVSTHKISTQTSANDLRLSIEQISLHNSQVTYTDLAKGNKLALKNINLDMQNVNIKGTPFDVDFAWETEFTQTKTISAPLLIKSKLHTSLVIGEGFNSLVLDKGELNLDIHATDSASVKLQYSLKVDDLKNNPHYQGKLIIPSINAKQIMAAFGSHYKTANEKSLTELSLTSDLDGDKKHIVLNALNVQLDKTHFGGRIALNDFSSQALAVDLQGDDLNADDYLAPQTQTQTQTQAHAPIATVQTQNTSAAPISAATGDEPLVPITLLRKLNLQVKVALNRLIFSNMPLEKVLVDMEAKEGILNQTINANAYAGSIHAKNTVNARADMAQLNFAVIVKGIELAPLLKDKNFDKSIQLTGSLQANASGQATGVTKNQILDSLTGNFTFAGDKVRLAPLNIEQQFCKLVSLVSQQEAPQAAWNTYTELQNLSGKATIAKRVITVENVNATVEKLLLGTNGTLNLVNGSYDFMLPLKLNRDLHDTPTSIATSAQGCSVTSNYWVERSMTLLRCKGAYAQMNPTKDCRPDKDQLNGLIKDFAVYKLKEKHGEKIEAKKSELLKKLDEKLGGEGKAEKAKELLKNLFKKKNDQ